MPSNESRSVLMWFRRDLRACDNTALRAALASGHGVHCAFIFDRAILDALPRADRRVEFIHQSLLALDSELRALSGHAHAGLIVRHGVAADELPRLAAELKVQAVYTNHDYEPAAITRDDRVLRALTAMGVAWHSSKDQVIFERSEVLTQGGKPYSVFTPYKNAWLKKLDQSALGAGQDADAATDWRRLAPRPAGAREAPPSLQQLGFEPTGLAQWGIAGGSAAAQALLTDFLRRIDAYDEARNYPAIKGPSYLSVHLRFGTVSVRQLAREALTRMRQGSSGASTWLSELIWRDFYFQILHNFPHVADAQGQSHSFRAEYNRIEWEQGPQAQALFDAWCDGRTGYPIVDAAMRQINQTGYMHNRLRMVVASFLTKDLGIDWRWGERYFAEKLNDFDLAANNGGWQWASSSGCDAQPYFRIFNPVSQSEKFDPQGKFIRRYLPELAALPDAALHAPWTARPVDLQAAGLRLGSGANDHYPLPIVDHAQAREKTLARYAVVKKPA